MAVLAGSSMSGGRKPMRSNSITFMSIAGVIGGSWVLFRLMAPKRGTALTTSEEVDAYRGSTSVQTDVGNKSARPPRKEYTVVPRGGSI